MPYTGTLIEESLRDWDILNRIDITAVKICTNPNVPSTLWHIYTVIVDRDMVFEISALLKPRGYYAHFGNEDEGFVVFPEKVFTIDPNRPETWQDAINYGLGFGIPEAQLDFSF